MSLNWDADIYEVSGAAKAEIRVVGVHSGSHERERAPTVLTLF